MQDESYHGSLAIYMDDRFFQPERVQRDLSLHPVKVVLEKGFQYPVFVFYLIAGKLDESRIHNGGKKTRIIPEFPFNSLCFQVQ